MKLTQHEKNKIAEIFQTPYDKDIFQYDAMIKLLEEDIITDKYEKENLVDRVQNALLSGEIGLRHLELAHLGYMRIRKDLPEGVRNQFAGHNVSILLRFAERINSAIGIATLSYHRAEQGKK